MTSRSRLLTAALGAVLAYAACSLDTTGSGDSDGEDASADSQGGSAGTSVGGSSGFPDAATGGTSGAGAEAGAGGSAGMAGMAGTGGAAGGAGGSGPLTELPPGGIRLWSGIAPSSALDVRSYPPQGQEIVEANLPDVPPPLRWVIGLLAPSPSPLELVAVERADTPNRELRLARWDGAAWTTDLAVPAPPSMPPTVRWFDIAFEATSGDALLVYAAGDSTPMYSVLSAGAWSADAPLPLNDGPSGSFADVNDGNVRWVELVPRASDDHIALLYSDDDDVLVAMEWSGTAWVTGSARQLEDRLKINTVQGEAVNRAFDADWESSTGALLAVWGRDNEDGVRWSRYSVSTWTNSARQQTPQSGRVHFVDLAAEPGTNRIAGGFYDLGDGTERLGAAIWDGSVWVNGAELDSQTRDVNDSALGDAPGGVVWTGAGTAICVYADSVPGGVDWARWTASSGWVLQPPVVVPGKGFTESVQLVRGAPGATVLVTDDSGALFGSRLSGTTWEVPQAPVLSVARTDSVAFWAAQKR